uniref:Uncharacterized protein n=1 Tax=Knipowitschia caucasica TaxID=637954 RepID=A0AAV2JJ72_KNICA
MLLHWETDGWIVLVFVPSIGKIQYKTLYNKRSRQWSLYADKVLKDYSYIKDLQNKVLQCRISTGKGIPKRTLRDNDPRRLGLVPSAPRPTTEELLQAHVSRGLGDVHQK